MQLKAAVQHKGVALFRTTRKQLILTDIAADKVRYIFYYIYFKIVEQIYLLFAMSQLRRKSLSLIFIVL